MLCIVHIYLEKVSQRQKNGENIAHYNPTDLAYTCLVHLTLRPVRLQREILLNILTSATVRVEPSNLETKTEQTASLCGAAERNAAFHAAFNLRKHEGRPAAQCRPETRMAFVAENCAICGRQTLARF